MQPPHTPSGFAPSPQPQAPGAYNPQAQYNPQMNSPPQAYNPVSPEMPYQSPPQASPYQNFLPPQTKSYSEKGNPFQNLKNKVSGFGVGPFIAVLFTTILISTSSTYFAMGGTMFSNSNPDEFTGKWYSADDGFHLYLDEDDGIQVWDAPRFECISGDETVPATFVNDGDEDCDDGSDEGTKRANSFNPSKRWLGVGDLLTAYNTAPGSHASGAWEVVDGELCVQLEYGSDPQGEFSTQTCLKSEVAGKALWVLEGRYLFSGGLPSQENGEERCYVWLDLGRANGPQSTDQQWVDTWNFALEDVYGSRPSFCQSTSFDSLKYGDSYYDY